jgi:predicted HD superfamily hydrolase involved in NAD metabolism
MTVDTQMQALRDAVEALPDWLCNHIRRVEDEAVRLARRYGEDVERARLAALGHDLVRHKNNEELLALAVEYEIEPDDIELRSPILIHGPVAARMLMRDYELEDDDIIAGVDCHTTARPNMARIEKVLFVADKIEPHKLRRNPLLQDVYDLAETDLDAAVVRFLDLRIEEALAVNGLIHPLLIEARNQLLMSR